MILASQNPTHNKDLKSQIDSKNTNSNRAVASCNDDKIDSKPLKNIESLPLWVGAGLGGGAF